MIASALGLFLALGSTPGAGVPPAADAATGATSDATAVCGGGATRQLGGHTFLFPILQQTAFVTTHVGIREGLARYEVPDLPIGRFGRRDVTLAGFQQTLDVGLRITEWLGAWGFARGTAITGVGSQAVLANGLSIDLQGEAGAVVRVYRNEGSGTQISLRGRYSVDKGRDITVFPLAEAIVNSPLPSLDELVNGNLGEFIVVPTKEQNVGGGVYAAQAFGGWFSLQGSVLADYAWQKRRPFDALSGTRLDENTNAFRVDLSLAAAVDFYPHVGVPIGVQGEYLFRTGSQEVTGRDDRTLHTSTVALGVYYTGRPNLQLGLGAVATLDAEPRRGLGLEGQDEESGTPTLTYGQVILRYIW